MDRPLIESLLARPVWDCTPALQSSWTLRRAHGPRQAAVTRVGDLLEERGHPLSGIDAVAETKHPEPAIQRARDLGPDLPQEVVHGRDALALAQAVTNFHRRPEHPADW